VFLRNPHVYGPNGALRRFTIPAQRTAMFELYPPGPNRGDARGYVNLRLPRKAAPGTTGKLTPFPQSDSPVRVLVQAESRITRVPEKFEAGSTGVILARSDDMTHPDSVSIAIASGKAENLIDAEGASRITDIGRVSLRDILTLAGARSYVGAEAIPDENRLAALLELLDQTDNSRATIDHINKLLEEAGISIRLC
jgi:riboflavin biosynthesis pyrimidine reductase